MTQQDDDQLEKFKNLKMLGEGLHLRHLAEVYHDVIDQDIDPSGSVDGWDEDSDSVEDYVNEEGGMELRPLIEQSDDCNLDDLGKLGEYHMRVAYNSAFGLEKDDVNLDGAVEENTDPDSGDASVEYTPDVDLEMIVDALESSDSILTEEDLQGLDIEGYNIQDKEDFINLIEELSSTQRDQGNQILKNQEVSRRGAAAGLASAVGLLAVTGGGLFAASQYGSQRDESAESTSAAAGADPNRYTPSQESYKLSDGNLETVVRRLEREGGENTADQIYEETAEKMRELRSQGGIDAGQRNYVEWNDGEPVYMAAVKDYDGDGDDEFLVKRTLNVDQYRAIEEVLGSSS